ncbi:DNA methyltransferase [Erythrobacter sp. HA6-11]
MTIAVHHADCVQWLAAHAAKIAAGEAEPFNSCVTDPPYHLTSIVKRFGKAGSAEARVPEGGTGAFARASKGFMGKEWDGGDVAFRPETWRAVFDCLKPGAHLVAFSGTRTFHRMACAIEDAGFEIRDQLAWVYGSGFPKSHDVSKAILRQAQDERGNGRPEPDGKTSPQDDAELSLAENAEAIRSSTSKWKGFGTALKPAWEPICLARKPISEKSVAAQVLATGTGAVNVDACRVGNEGGTTRSEQAPYADSGWRTGHKIEEIGAGRWPANILHDGSAPVLDGFENGPGGGAARATARPQLPQLAANSSEDAAPDGVAKNHPSRFFYSAKAGPLDRIGTTHATVKPVDLMRWLVRLITPPGGVVLEPFAGSGTTGIAALAEGFACTMIEMEADHVADIERKLAVLRGEGAALIHEHDRQRETRKQEESDPGPLFAEGGAA